MLRSYLVGKHFTARFKHRPLTPFHNNTSTPTSIGINHIRKKGQDLKSMNKHISGKNYPRSYKSRKPTNIKDLNKETHKKGVKNTTNTREDEKTEGGKKTTQGDRQDKFYQTMRQP